jgi:hypothetical protein
MPSTNGIEMCANNLLKWMSSSSSWKECEEGLNRWSAQHKWAIKHPSSSSKIQPPHKMCNKPSKWHMWLQSVMTTIDQGK